MVNRQSSTIQNNTRFKPKNGYNPITLNEEEIPVNNKMLEPKRDYDDINIDEEDKPNKLVTFCTSNNQNSFVHPFDPDYDDKITDEGEQIIKNETVNDLSFNYECSKTKITGNTSNQKKIDMNNVENHIAENSIKCSSFNDKIKNVNKAHMNKLRNEQNLIVSKKKNHVQMNECTLYTNTKTEKKALNTNTDKKISYKTINTSDGKKSLLIIINKNNYTLTSNNTYEEINPSTRITPKKTNTLTTNIFTSNEHNKINMLTTHTQTSNENNAMLSNTNKDENTFTGNLSKNNYVLTRNDYKNKNTIATNTPTILISEIKSCVYDFIGIVDDTRSIDNDSDQNHTDNLDGEPNYVTNDVNLLKDNITIYCKENWPTILKKLSDPLKGIKVFESILFNKAYALMIRRSTKNKIDINKTKHLIVNWQSQFQCLEFSMKTIIDSKKCDRNTRHISIQNQNQMDITLCKNIEVGEKKNNSDIIKKVSTDLQNNIIPENFKTPKLYQHSLNSENKNLTESVTDIKTNKYKEIQTNIPFTQTIADLIKNIPLSTTVSILSPESLNSNKRNLTDSNTCITRTKAKIIKTQHSSIPNFDHMDVHILPDTTASKSTPKSFYTKQNNITQFDSGIKMTQFRTIKSNEQSTLVSTNVCPNPQNLTQYDSEIESNMNNYNEPSTPASIDITVNNPKVITRLYYNSLSNQKNASTQHNTDIKKTKSKIMESTPPFIDLTVDIPPYMRASSVSPNMFNSQSSLTQCSTQLECYEPSTSMSTDLSGNSSIFSSPSLRANTSNGNPALLGRRNVQARVVQKDAQLSTIKSNIIRRADWINSKNLTVLPQNIIMSHKSAHLPVAVKRALKPKLPPPSSNVQ